MKGVFGPRRGGKTHYLVQELRKHPNGCLLVPREAHRRLLMDSYQLTDAQIMVARPSILRGWQGEAYVDNVDWLLEAFLGRPVHTISYTGTGVGLLDPNLRLPEGI